MKQKIAAIGEVVSNNVSATPTSTMFGTLARRMAADGIQARCHYGRTSPLRARLPVPQPTRLASAATIGGSSMMRPMVDGIRKVSTMPAAIISATSWA
jgi:hypothetical protein